MITGKAGKKQSNCRKAQARPDCGPAPRRATVSPATRRIFKSRIMMLS